jgi:hypothetical protein
MNSTKAPNTEIDTLKANLRDAESVIKHLRNEVERLHAWKMESTAATVIDGKNRYKCTLQVALCLQSIREERDDLSEKFEHARKALTTSIPSDVAGARFSDYTYMKQRAEKAEADLHAAKNPTREELVNLCRKRAVMDTNGLSIVEAFHTATFRWERAEKENAALRRSLKDVLVHCTTPHDSLTEETQSVIAFVDLNRAIEVSICDKHQTGDATV